MSKARILKRIKKGRYKSNKAIRQALNAAYRSELRRKATPSEKLFESYLQSNGIKYIFQKGFITPFHRIVDFYLPKLSTIIEIDGGYHLEREVKEKDEMKDLVWLKQRNMKTVRITNEEVENGTFKLKLQLL